MMIRILAAALATSTCIVALATPAAAQTREYNIPAGSLKSALDAYVRQSGRQVIYRTDQIRSARSPGTRGQQSAEAALAAILAGSGFTIRVDGNLVAIVLAMGNEAAVAGPADILVTGSRIRGNRSPSPVISIGSTQIRQEGFADLGEVIRSIPQNFSGGQNPGVSSGNISGAGLANQNLTGGSGLNLRGLGPDATLTLLNGRRLAYGGFVQSVDIGAIPVEAVDRLEIVPDGASAIYGSDAVGGVGNVILKTDYNGLALSGRIGGATDGGLATYEYSGTAGTTWSSGGFIVTYQNISVDPIYARQRDYAAFLLSPTTLYPGSDLRSGVLSAHQRLGDIATLRIDGIRSQRDQEYYYYLSGVNSIDTRTTATFIAPSVEFALPMGWTATLGATWGSDDHIQYQTRATPMTGAITVVSNTCYCNETGSYEGSAEGPLFALPGGDARLAIGGGYRTVEFVQRARATATDTVAGEESTKFAYAELNLPLIGPQSNIGAIHRLTLTAAIRGEDYDSFGSIATPKIGLVYEPGPDVALRATWGRSFKAPTLLQRFQPKNVFLYPPTPFGGTGYPAGSTTLAVVGGNPDLRPERASTWSASLSFHPQSVPGLQVELTGFHIDYTDRVVQPIANSAQSLSNPLYAQFIDTMPTSAQQAALITSAAGFFNFAGATYDPTKVVAIINLQFLNAARQKIKGLDLSSSYRMDLGSSALTLRGSLSWLDSAQQVSAAQAPYDLAGTLFNPARVTGRAGAAWEGGGLSASAFVNYKDGVRNTVRQETTDSFVTVDATLRYDTGERGRVLSGLSFVLAVQNLFDAAPPFYTSTTSAAFAVPYDSTNYSPIGRFVSLTVAKRF